jgi:hypothetical protein
MYSRIIFILAVMLIAFPSASNAQKPPWKGCDAISKKGYKSGKKLTGYGGTYVRTGRLGRRYYWFCR